MSVRIRPLLIGATALALVGWGVWSASWSGREARRWDGCLGRPLAGCAIPEGYEPRAFPCPAWQRCTTLAPATRAVSIAYPEAPTSFWSSRVFAVLSLDARDRIVGVEIERIHTVP